MFRRSCYQRLITEIRGLVQKVVLPEADMKSKSWICWEKICLVYVKKDKIYVNILTVFQQYFIYDTTFSIISCLPGKTDPAIKRGDTKGVVRVRHVFVPVPTRAWISSVMCCGLFFGDMQLCQQYKI